MKIAVTGAGGFIGRAVCERLAADGAQPIGIDVAPGAWTTVEEAGARFVLADIRDGAAICAALDDCEGVIHTAALLGDAAGMAAQIDVNVRGTVNVLDAARVASVERVVHVSSVATWGYDFASDIPESSTARVCGVAYVDTKTASQLIALRRGAAVVRPGDVYGPRSSPWTIRPVQALSAGTFFLPGDGSGLMTPVYVDDLVDCLVRALEHPDAGGRAVTAWDGSAVTARDFFGNYARMLGRDRIRCLPEALLKAGALAIEARARLTGTTPDVTREALRYISRRAVYPNDDARELLGWEPSVDLDEGMRRTEVWLRDQGLLTL